MIFLLKLLEEWKERKWWNATCREMTPCSRTPFPSQFGEVLVIAHNQPVLLAETKRVMMRKFDQSNFDLFQQAVHYGNAPFYPIRLCYVRKVPALQCRRVFQIWKLLLVEDPFDSQMDSLRRFSGNAMPSHTASARACTAATLAVYDTSLWPTWTSQPSRVMPQKLVRLLICLEMII
jgi:hypothetical protein